MDENADIILLSSGITGNFKLPSGFLIISSLSAAWAGDTFDLPDSPSSNIFTSSSIISFPTPPLPRSARLGLDAQPLSNPSGIFSVDDDSSLAVRRVRSGAPSLLSSISRSPFQIIIESEAVKELLSGSLLPRDNAWGTSEIDTAFLHLCLEKE